MLQPGQTLAHYRLVEKIGEGGMGVVWRAVDESLAREVAIKVLPAAFAEDAERLARFEREAKLLASLSHPNIAVVHGLQQHDGVRFLAMELALGEDLAERLGRGRIPVDEALELARQLTDALQAAHQKGVIHRDLKPANIKLDAEGQIKVLDFGLAKAFDPDPSVSGSRPDMSPTLTSGGTAAGVILGTAAYMSPEQARGGAVDKRADIWAFGAVLYEMLTGARAFGGETVSDTLASVLKVEPDWDLLPTGTPASVRRLLRRCLTKHPKQRLHDIGDARIEIDEAVAEPEVDGASPAVAVTGARWKWVMIGVLAGLALGAVIGALALRGSDAPAVAGRSAGPRRMVIQVPDEAPLAIGRAAPLSISRPALAISPDGSRVVFVGATEPESRLLVRSMDSFEASPISGTEGAFLPMFSPDGEWVAFFTRGELKKVALRGGEPVVLCEAQVVHGGTWGDDGMIYFAYSEDRLARVAEDGGEPENFTDVSVFYPHALPEGKGLIVTIRGRAPTMNRDGAAIAHLSPDGELKVLHEGGHHGRYVPSGHLVFMRGGGLYAAPFDLERLELTGPPASVLKGVWSDSIWAVAHYDFSNEGTLVYVGGGDWARTVPTWIDRQGDEEPLALPPQVYNMFSLSPDRRRLAIQVTGAEDQIYVHDPARETFARLTLEGGNFFPVWTTDGKRIIFSSVRGGVSRIYRMPVDGSGDAERLMTDEQVQSTETRTISPVSVSPDGRNLLVMPWGHAQRWADIWVFPLDGEGELRPVVATEANEILASFSPDGRWITYLSDRTGRYEVFVRPFPDSDRREWQVSSGGGDDPRWSPRGDELIYRDGSRLMSVRYTTEPDFMPGPPRVVLLTDFHNSAGFSFDVSADGERFLVNKPVIADAPAPPIRVVLDWFDELNRLAG